MTQNNSRQSQNRKNLYIKSNVGLKLARLKFSYQYEQNSMAFLSNNLVFFFLSEKFSSNVSFEQIFGLGGLRDFKD